MADEKDQKTEEQNEKSANRGSADSGKEEVKDEKSAESEKKFAKFAPSGKFKDLIKKIEELSVMELADLVKELEERFGVSATAMAAPTSGAVGAPTESVGEEKTNFTVHLLDSGTQKIAVIKAVRIILPDLGLKEAKDLVDGAPKDVKKDMPKEEAEKAKKVLEEAGAKVELK